MNNTRGFLDRCNALMQGQDPAVVLRRALEVLRVEEQWTWRTRAEDANGRAVAPDDPTAVRWDIEGAIAMACNPYGILPPYFMVLLDAVATELTQKGTWFEHLGWIYGVNLFEETYSHDEIIRLIETAISWIEG